MSAYIEEDLKGQALKAFEEHLQKCAACREELASMESIIHELRYMDRIAPPDDFITNLNARLEEHSTFNRTMRTLFFPGRIKIAVELTALAATVLLLFLMFNISQPFKRIMDSTSGKENGKVTANIQRDLKGPIHLDLLVEPVNGEAPLSSDNIVTVTSGIHPKASDTGEFGIASGLSRHSPEKDRWLLNQKNLLLDINNIISYLGGRLLSEDYENKTGTLRNITLEIPSENYRPFIDRIKRIGTLQNTAPELSDRQGRSIQVRIQIKSQE